MNQINKQTFSDLSVIFKMMPYEMIKKINPKFINFIKENYDKNYTSNIKPYIPIRKQDISIETQSVLALIYESYLATDEEKRKILKERNELIGLKYNTDNLFKNIKDKKRNNENKELIIVKKQSFFEKIINKIKLFFTQGYK